MNKFYTTRQVADLMGVSPPTVIKWFEEGVLDGHRTPGGHRRVSHEALTKFSENCGTLGERELGGESAQSGRICVLVVDSEPDFADTVAEYLDIQGEVEVVQAIGPLDVGFAIGRYTPDVVLFDVDAQGIEARDIGRLLASHSRTSRIYLLTSSLDMGVERLAAEMDGCDLLQKPVKLDGLWSLIRSA